MHQAIPSLSDPTVSRSSLLLGFSYSLTPDGVPGSYNESIATSIIEHMRVVSDDALPHVAIQWEIRDALGGAYTGPKPHVAGPPFFTEQDIGQRNDDERARDDAATAVVRILKNGETKATRALAKEMQLLLCEVGYPYDPKEPNKIFDFAALNHKRLPIYLNRLLKGDRRDTFYVDFQASLELEDLRSRIELGALGVEKRELPTGKAPLLPFQTQRVNRLIVEAAIPDPKILQRFKYLSTQGVLDDALAALRSKREEVKHVFVFGHPAHSPRCRRQTIESLWKAGWEIPTAQVYDVHLGQEWPWDSSTAQVWCRNPENWKDYENMGIRRL